MGEKEFRKTAGDILRALRNSQKAPGCDRIYTPGEKAYETWLSRKDSGIPVGESVQKELSQVRDMYKLDYRFDWENKGRYEKYILCVDQVRPVHAV